MVWVNDNGLERGGGMGCIRSRVEPRGLILMIGERGGRMRQVKRGGG